MGFSPKHGREVPLILNPTIAHISPQLHVIFDYAFSTVVSISNDDPPPSFWDEIDIDEFMYTIPLDEDSDMNLSDD